MSIRSWQPLVLAIAAVLLASGCTTAWNIETLQETPRVGHRHNVALMDEYQDLAVFEAGRGDWTDADYFALKGLAASYGQQVLPDEVAARAVPESVVQELIEARAQLVAILYSGGRDFQPELVAHCQALYDCWIAEAEEDQDDSRIMVCRDGFYECLMAAGGRPQTGPGAADAQNFVILFDFDSAALTTAGRAVVEQAVVAALADPTLPIAVVGYTDTAGAPEYNQLLSRARAEAVRDLMVARGVDAGRIQMDAVGEREPAEATGDGVRNAANRRVVITLS
ncbi:MAG: OmpA family protein [Alphaproteobacteria bacterium]